MTVSAKLVMELRERTGCGMMECKKFLVEANGDIDLAIDQMRKAGQAKADKKKDRIAAEGVIVILRTPDGKSAVMLEINTETDFSARDAEVNSFANTVAQVALHSGATDVETLSAEKTPAGVSVEEARQALIAKVGENIKIRRIERMQSDGVVGTYLHSARIGVMVALKNGTEELAKDLAMHIAASKPEVVAREQVTQQALDKEREIFTAQATESGKPQAIIDKMIEGRLNKYKDEVSLLGQPFVKNPDIRISQLLKENNAEVLAFVRMEVGEGIEKKVDNFVEEVMAQVREQS